MTQKETVLRHLNRYGSITQKKAWDSYGISRLAAIIALLKKDGCPITSQLVPVPTRTGAGTWVAKYTLEK